MLTLLLQAHPTQATDFSQPGPYKAGWRQVRVMRPDGSAFNAILYYPASQNGSGAPYYGGGAPYPAVSFGHGFMIDPSYYRSTLAHLATWGYFVIATRSGLGLFPGHLAYANDLRHSLTHLENENARPGTWLYGQVDTAHMGIAGHSMGGGAGILATAADARVKALATLAAAETRPSAIAAMASIAVPVRLLAGDEDGIVGWQSNTGAMYDNGLPPRQRLLIKGGWHCGFMDSNFLFCDSGSLPRSEQLQITRQQMAAFFNLYLHGDQGAWPSVWGPESMADPRVDVLADSGISLAPPAQNGQVPVGTVAVYTLTLTNSGAHPDSFAILTAGNAWPTAVTPAQTPSLGPGQSIQVTVEVQAPGNPGQDTALISARSNADGGTRQYATVTTQATP